MATSLRTLEPRIQDLLPELERVYTDIHAHPELSHAGDANCPYRGRSTPRRWIRCRGGHWQHRSRGAHQLLYCSRCRPESQAVAPTCNPVISWFAYLNQERSCDPTPVSQAHSASGGDGACGRGPRCEQLGIEECSTQNIAFRLADSCGMRCSTSQCSTILPSAFRRKMSMPAQSPSFGQC